MQMVDPIANLVKIKAQSVGVSKDLALLFVSRVLMRVSLGALGVFLPIYLYNFLQGDIKLVVLIFASIYMLHVLLAPIAAKLFEVWGMRRMMWLGIAMASVSVLALYFLEQSPVYGIVFYILSVSIYRAFYWVPYQVDLSRELDEQKRGRQLALMANLSDALVVVVPFLGGVAIAVSGFEQVFLFASFLMLLAIIPLLFISDVYERYSWGYLQSFAKLFSKENRSLFIAQAANGAQSVVTLFFWPLYVYLISQKQFVVLGAVTSATIVLIMALRYATGKWFDKAKKDKLLLTGVLLSATGWFFKVFVQTPLQAIFVDTYHRMGRAVNGLTFSAVTYEQSADSGSYIDEYTTLKEMAVNLGRVLMLLVVGILLLKFNLKIAFIVAAIVTLFMIILEKFEGIR